MKGNVASAIALEHLDPASGQNFRRSQHIGRLGIAPERNDGSVFQQQQHVADPGRLAQINQFLLQAKAGSVIELTEFDDGNHVAI
jgi:hypothetical protein